VPANSTATLYLPTKSFTQITESGKAITTWTGVKVEGENVVIPLSSGDYIFVLK
jgi:alpha-L-rhamnosidase